MLFLKERSFLQVFLFNINKNKCGMAKEKSFMDWIFYGVLSLLLIVILGFVALVLYSLISVT